MKNLIKSIIIIFASVSLAACQGSMDKRGGGTLIGGVTGGLIGSQFGGGEGKLIATGIGALAGALVGGHIGKSMDEYDKRMLENSSRQALEFSPSGSRVEWKNPDSGNSGSITPTKTYKDKGSYCREYYQEIIIAGEKQKAYGKACRKPDGQWQIVK